MAGPTKRMASQCFKNCGLGLLLAHQVFMEVEYYIHNAFELKNIKLSQNENMLLQSPLNCIIILFGHSLRF
jgi:hypothetical protein